MKKFKVVETFSGIGSQAKALKDIEFNHEIINTVDWDINAIIAYDLIHSENKEILEEYKEMKKEDLLNLLDKYSLSLNGKKLAEKSSIKRLHIETLRRLATAIKRTNNLVSIVDVKSSNLPNEMDLLTYSFPCQDLSNAGFWHGNKGGIDRDANNRSTMLWQVERILLDRKREITEGLNKKMPRYLLMENVTSILSSRNINNFNEWKSSLRAMGYISQEVSINALNSGSVQRRVRTYMISVYVGDDIKLKEKVEDMLSAEKLRSKFCKDNFDEAYRKKMLKEKIKTDYKKTQYKSEAIEAQPNDTNSRRRIYEKCLKILNSKTKEINKLAIPTVTTKQDRFPNSGVIDFPAQAEGKSDFRYLTPRECFLLMGFSEEDYDVLINNNFKKSNTRKFFTNEKLYRMAGNSIIVEVLKDIFEYIREIEVNCFENEQEAPAQEMQCREDRSNSYNICNSGMLLQY